MLVFFFNDTATTEIYTLSLHDALPIYLHRLRDAEEGKHVEQQRHDDDASAHAEQPGQGAGDQPRRCHGGSQRREDRKSTRLNSSHANISYAVFCLKKKIIRMYYNHANI